MTTIFRAFAVAIALAAAVDPALPVRRTKPTAVEVLTGPSQQAAAIRDRLMFALADVVTLALPGQGDAVVVIDRLVDTDTLLHNVPISVVTIEAVPNMRVARASAPSPSLAGSEGIIDVDVEVQGLAARTATITVAQDGIEIGRVERLLTAARRQRVSVPYVAIAAGTHNVRVTAVPFDQETRQDDNAIDTAISTAQRPLQIAFVERRPSWSGGFVRRVVETDPAFEVASVVHASRGIDVRAGDPPRQLTPAALERFDVIIVGAPEELSANDVETLRSFMAERGGTVFFLPDRRPSGPYASFVTAAGFDEVLLDTPAVLRTAIGGEALRASEFAIPRTMEPAMKTLASLANGRPAIVSRPVGEGQLIFSGALDAWRFRTDGEDTFAWFWRASLAAAALAAPPALEVYLDPAAVRPGADTRIVAKLRRTELERRRDGSLDVPEIRAVAVGKDKSTAYSEPVRLWPTAEPGIFEGRFSPVERGSYYVHAEAAGAQSSALRVEVDVREPVGGDDEEAAIVALGTGGVAVRATDLAPLIDHLRALHGAETPAAAYPMRSAWWSLPFALALCAEWTIRRRRGWR